MVFLSHLDFVIEVGNSFVTLGNWTVTVSLMMQMATQWIQGAVLWWRW